MRRTVATLSTCLLVAAACVTASTAPAAAAGCTDITFIGVRGSGEHINLGATVAAVYNRLRADMITNHKTSTIKSVPINYPAVAVGYGGLNHYGQNYIDSVNAGDAALVNVIDSINAGPCGVNAAIPTTIVLVGYSQGAQVAADTYVYELTDQERFLLGTGGVFLIADPRFQGADAGIDYGNYGPKLDGIARHLSIYHAYRTWPPIYPPTVVSMCMAHDPICTYTAGTLAFCAANSSRCPHTNYQNFIDPRTGLTWANTMGDFVYNALFNSPF